MSNTLSHDNFMRVDPDHRQNRGDGKCKTRKMTKKEWKKYGPKSDLKRRNTGFIISVVDVKRVSKRKRA
jgi:hypothetical protein